jgi:hypothetical protein
MRTAEVVEAREGIDPAWMQYSTFGNGSPLKHKALGARSSRERRRNAERASPSDEAGRVQQRGKALGSKEPHERLRYEIGPRSSTRLETLKGLRSTEEGWASGWNRAKAATSGYVAGGAEKPHGRSL